MYSLNAISGSVFFFMMFSFICGVVFDARHCGKYMNPCSLGSLIFSELPVPVVKPTSVPNTKTFGNIYKKLRVHIQAEKHIELLITNTRFILFVFS